MLMKYVPFQHLKLFIICDARYKIKQISKYFPSIRWMDGAKTHEIWMSEHKTNFV